VQAPSSQLHHDRSAFAAIREAKEQRLLRHRSHKLIDRRHLRSRDPYSAASATSQSSEANPLASSVIAMIVPLRHNHRAPSMLLSDVANQPKTHTGQELTLYIISEMEDRLDTGCASQERLLLMLFERLVVLRHIHRQAKIFLVPGRQCGCHRMPQRPAQP